MQYSINPLNNLTHLLQLLHPRHDANHRRKLLLDCSCLCLLQCCRPASGLMAVAHRRLRDKGSTSHAWTPRRASDACRLPPSSREPRRPVIRRRCTAGWSQLAGNAHGDCRWQGLRLEGQQRCTAGRLRWGV
jgi:hypothetical protein